MKAKIQKFKFKPSGKKNSLSQGRGRCLSCFIDKPEEATVILTLYTLNLDAIIFILVIVL